MASPSITKHGFSAYALSRAAALAAALALAASNLAGAQEACGLCDEEIVTNSDLATCFLEQYPALVQKANGAIVVDLSTCEAARGVVEALPSPQIEAEEPDTRFMVSRAQLDCLKRKLEDPDLVLDPAATIKLDSCG